jgi:hypothetical protein
MLTRAANLLGCALLLFAYGCSGTETPKVAGEQPFIAPPIPELDPKFQTFEVDNEKPEIIKLSNGGSIKLAPNSLVDSLGKALKGKVQIKYREFHNAADVFLSGIPMTYDEGGTKGNFQTAGMFELRASQNNTPVGLDEKKPALVRMASYEAGDDYDFFQLVEKDRTGWRKKGHSKPEINVEKKKRIDKVSSQLKTVVQLDKKHFVFSFDGVIDATYNNERAKINSEGDKVSKSKAQKYGIDQLGINGHQYIEYKKAHYASSLVLWKNLGKNFPDWTRNTDKIYNFNLEKVSEGVYNLSVSHVDKSQNFQTKIQFVMPLKSLFAFPAEHWKNNYQETFAKVEAEIARMSAEADVFRSFEVSGMGIYNYDKLMKEDDAIITKAEFKPDASVASDATYTLNTVFYIADDKTLIKLNKTEWDKVVLLPNAKKAHFITVLPGNAIGIFTAEEYQKIDFDALKKQPIPTYTFTLNKKIDRLADAKELNLALGL